MVACSKQRQRFLEMKTAVICLQACTRGLLDRKLATRERAARMIQATYNMHKVRGKFLALRRVVVQMQAQTRMVQQRRRFNNLKSTAVVIQRRYRATVLCKRDKIVYHFTRGAVITIQMFVRGFLVRARLRRMNNAALKIQACVRGSLARKKYENYQESCTRITASMPRLAAWPSGSPKLQCVEVRCSHNPITLSPIQNAP